MERLRSGTAPTLSGRHLLITGAGGGLGGALVRGALDRGALVYATDRSRTELAKLETLAPDGRLELIDADLSEPAAPRSLTSRVFDSGGRLDGLINNAAVLIPKPIEEVSIADFDVQVAVNLRAPFLLSQSVAEASLAGGAPCHIVNVLSGAARTGGLYHSAVYAATKAGLLALTKGFARTYGPRGLRVNAVAPSAMSGPMNRYRTSEELAEFAQQVPLRRFGDPIEVAAAVLWLLSDEASFVTGATLDVSGGWTMI